MRDFGEIFAWVFFGLIAGIVQLSFFNRADGLVYVNVGMVVLFVLIARRMIDRPAIFAVAYGFTLDWFSHTFPLIHVLGCLIAGLVFWLINKKVVSRENWIAVLFGAFVAVLLYGVLTGLPAWLSSGGWDRDRVLTWMWSYLVQYIFCAVAIAFTVYHERKSNIRVSHGINV